MNQGRTFLIFLSLVISLSITGCEEDFAGDTFDPRLPEYSEDGNNHAGAYINDEPWRAYPRFTLFVGTDDAYLDFDSLTDTYEMVLPQGNLINASGGRGADLGLRFVLSSKSVAPIVDGTAEYPVVIQLDGEEAHAELRRGGTIVQADSSGHCSSAIGLLHIRHVSAQGPADDEAGTRILIAGTFGFDIEDECGRYEVRSGRFDFRFRCFWEGCF